jgi:DNA-binding transcriptional ArsR family regulator
MAAAHIVNFPIDIDEICARLEAGEETYKVSNDTGYSPSMLSHYYKAYRGKPLSEARERLRGKQRKVSIDEG